MARKLPVAEAVDLIKSLRNTALGAAKDPRATSERVLGQAKDVATMGRQVAGGVAGQVAERISRQLSRRRAVDAPHAEAPRHAPLSRTSEAAPAPAREPASAPTVPAASPADVAKKAAAKRAPVKKAGTKTAKKAAKQTAKKPARKTAPSAEKSSAGDKLPPRRTTRATPPPAPRDIEPNPEVS